MSRSCILVVGAGGREHAIAWRLARDPEPARVVVAPGNDGMARRFERVALDPLDPAAVRDACRAHGVTLAVIGPEAPLAAGVADALIADGTPVFGPVREAARVESSKWHAKNLMREAGIPTARAETFENAAAACDALDRFAPPWVVKADGLAAGKGVLVSAARREVESFVRDCLDGGRFGAGGRRVVIEEHLAGEEASVMAVCDGARFALLPAARDYKRAHDGDRGGNTGGMGAVAPHDGVDDALERTVGERIVAPLLDLMARRGTPYRGVLYCGLMLGPGGPRVVEFNCRFGDPETEAVLPLVGGSLRLLLEGAASGGLGGARVERVPGATVAVALTDTGYPEAAGGGGVIEGLDALGRDDDVTVFHAATRFEDGAWRVRGGRAAYVAARGATREAARARVYEAIATLGGAGWRCRADIAAPAAAGTSGARERN